MRVEIGGCVGIRFRREVLVFFRAIVGMRRFFLIFIYGDVVFLYFSGIVLGWVFLSFFE